MSIFRRFLTTPLFAVQLVVHFQCFAMSAEASNEKKAAVVVHTIEGRIYLSIGRLDGISSNWVVSRLSDGSSGLNLPLAWIGDDLCRIEPDSEIAGSARVGDTVWLEEFVLPAARPAGRIVRWAVTMLPVTIKSDPVTLNDWDFREAVYNRLGEFVEKTEVDEDGSLILHLWTDKELRFANGTPVDTDVIRESLGWLCGRRQPFWIWAEHFNSIRDTFYSVPVNPFTIQTNLPSYCDSYRSLIDEPGFCVADIGQTEGLMNGHPAGSGAYMIAGASDSMIVLCQRGDPYGFCLVDTVVYQSYGSYDAARLAFELGEADILEIAPYDVRRFENHYEVLRDTLNSAVFLSVNNSLPYLSDNLFAVALNYLVDRQSLCRVPLAQMVVPVDRPPVQFECKVTGPFAYDPRKGRQLLAQISGLPQYMSLLVADRNDPGMLRTAEYIRGVLARHNISLTIYTSAYSEDTIGTGAFLRSFDMMIARLDTPSGSDGQMLYQSFYHDGIDEVESNRSLFRSGELEELFRESFLNCLGETRKGRKAMNDIIYRHLNAASGVWLYAPVRHIAVSRKIISMRFLPGGVVDLAGIEAE